MADFETAAHGGTGTGAAWERRRWRKRAGGGHILETESAGQADRLNVGGGKK